MKIGKDKSAKKPKTNQHYTLITSHWLLQQPSTLFSNHQVDQPPKNYQLQLKAPQRHGSAPS